MLKETNMETGNRKEQLVLIRYGEISLKGKNRPAFENRLVSNIKRALGDLGRPGITRLRGRLMLELKDVDSTEAMDRLGKVFGIVSFSPVRRVEAEPERIYEAALESLQRGIHGKGYTPGEQRDAATFRVTVKRADKSFPVNSIEFSRRVGAYLLECVPSLKVDLHHPELYVSIDIREGQAYIFSESLPGPGGLPVGVSGKGMLLLSGGIDSPVAGWMSMKRGIELEAVHFHSFPFTGEKSKEKVVDLCRVLARYGGRVVLHVAHFTGIQKTIHKHCPEELRITIMRRFMFRIAQRLAEKNNALALITGESVGQVASQTLESMAAINEVTLMPVLRPLVGFDKKQIVELAEKVGSYHISIQPYEDCCTLFLPKHPSTKPRLDKVRAAEEGLDVEGMIGEALEKTESLIITRENENTRSGR